MPWIIASGRKGARPMAMAVEPAGARARGADGRTAASECDDLNFQTRRRTYLKIVILAPLPLPSTNDGHTCTASMSDGPSSTVPTSLATGGGRTSFLFKVMAPPGRKNIVAAANLHHAAYGAIPRFKLHVAPTKGQ